ncbi:DUF4249 domain-containing protein [Fibrella sp. WM1]|uniref:DUF4249 domain-containing protein n=1 Tax=Fibrella musci TaxID=3242485 RepID=UPI0035207434
MKTSHLLYALLLVGLFGCGGLVQEVSVDNIPSAKLQMVVQSFISPQDTVIAVYVDYPTSILGLYGNGSADRYPYRRPIQEATVDLSDGTKTVRLTRRNLPIPPNNYSSELFYGVDAREFPIIAGRTYTLTASAPGFPSVSARCTVPAPVQPDDIRLDSTVYILGNGRQVDYLAQLRWRDPVGTPAYYHVTGRLNADITQPNFQTDRDTTYQTSQTLSLNSEERYQTDQNRDGQSMVSGNLKGTAYYWPKDAPESRSTTRFANVSLTLTLQRYDENLYRFRDAILRQNRQGDNPFAEPVLITSNIQNGLGCFGAYNGASLTLKIN